MIALESCLPNQEQVLTAFKIFQKYKKEASRKNRLELSKITKKTEIISPSRAKIYP
ncbi:MAG TPA: hypothetical protein VKZ76_06505 [Edaphocola sp.]|nr:hypothetical protein [Edaphocola sp.]